MDKENNKALLILLTIGVVVGLIVSFFTLAAVKSVQVDEDQIVRDVVNQIGRMPTPAEVAALVPKVDMPAMPEVIMPEIPEFKSDEKVKDLWEDMYSAEIFEIENFTYVYAIEVLEDDKYEELVEFLEENVENFEELEDVDVEDFEVEVISLGLKKEEDKVAQIVFEIEVEYSLYDGPVQDYRDHLLVTADVVYDEGDFDDEDVEMVYAFA